MGQDVTDLGFEKKAGKHELKKHAATIHCSNSLSLLQRKISNALLYHAYKELLLKEEHEITVKQLCNLIAYSGNNHSVIKEALKELLCTVIEWNVVNDTTGNEDWSASSILASVSLQGPLCLYAYSPRMKQLLHSPSMFAKIDLFIQSRFKSSYGLALYENCIRYRGLPHTKWFELPLFRKLMGVPNEKYPIFRDFKRRVLDKSIEEVNTYSDLVVEPEVYREGRQVIKIRFILKERAKKTRLGNKIGATEESAELATLPLSNKEILLKRMLEEYNLSEDQGYQVLTDYSEDFILQKMELILSSKNYQEGKVQNVAAYFLSALKNDYQPPKQNVSKAVSSKKENSDFKKLENLFLKIKKDYAQYRDAIIDKIINELNVVDYAYFIRDFKEFAAISIANVLKLQKKKYNQETILQSPQIQIVMRQFSLKVLPVNEKIIPFESYVASLPEKTRETVQQYLTKNAQNISELDVVSA